MSKSAGTKTTTDAGTQTTSYDPAIQQQWANLYDQASSQPNNPYGGQMVANLTPDQLAAADMARANVGYGTGTAESGVGALQNAAGYQPGMVAPQYAQTPAQLQNFYQAAMGGTQQSFGAANTTAQQVQAALANSGQVGQDASMFGQTVRDQVRDVSAQSGAQGMDQYFNPYQQQVVQQSLQDLDRFRMGTAGQAADAAAAAGAFGGSRHGIVEAGVNRDFAAEAGNLAGRLNHQGFEFAAGQGQTDANRFLQAQGMNQGADLSAATSGLQMAGNIGMSNAQQANMVGMSNADRALQSAMANQSAGLQAQQLSAANRAQMMNLGLGALGMEGNMNQFNSSLGMQGQLANQSAGLAGNAQRLSAGGALVNAGATQQGMGQSAANHLNSFGQQQWAQNQMQNDAAYQDFLRQQAQGQQNFNNQLNTLNQTPTGSTQTHDNTTSQPLTRNAGVGALGGAATGAKIGSAFGPWGTAGGAAIGGLLGWLG